MSVSDEDKDHIRGMAVAVITLIEVGLSYWETWMHHPIMAFCLFVVAILSVRIGWVTP